MKILHASADWKWTGPAEPMLHGITGLRERGHSVHLACPAPPPGIADGLLVRAVARGINPVHEMQRGQGYRPWRDRREVAALGELLARESYDLVHVHHSRDHLLCRRALRGLRAAEGSRTPRLVASWHRGEEIPTWPWHRWLLGPRGLSGLTVLSECIAQAAVRDLRFPSERVAVLPGVVDTKHFAPRERLPSLGPELGIGPAHRVIGIVARLQPHRRFELLLDAFARALREAPELRLLVVGRGTRAQSVLEEPVSRLNLEGAVLRAGYRRDDFRDVLAWLDALVFLVPGSDGSCRAALEAMSMGIPVIASQRGVLPDLVVPGETGAVLREDAEALAASFVDVARDPARWRVRGTAARLRVLARHPIERHAQQLEQFYRSLL